MLLFVQKMCDLRVLLSDAVSNINWFDSQVTKRLLHVMSPLSAIQKTVKNKKQNPMKNKINLKKLCENPIKLLTDTMVKKLLFSWCFKSMFAVIFNASFQYRPLTGLTLTTFMTLIL